MADTKITALTAITTVDPAVDVLPIVDVSDTSMAASGTTKKITSNQILGAGGTATLASATITGDLTVDTSTLKVDSANDRVGIGTASPATGTKLDIAGFVRGTSGAVFQGANNLTTGVGLELGYSTSSAYSFLQSFDRSGAAYKPIRLIGSSIDFDIANSVKATIDSSGNVGIGVTPSAWRSTQKALQLGAVGQFFSSAASGGSTAIGRNVYENSAGDFTYIVNDEATFYEQTATGVHAWYTAAAGTGTISFGSAKMTLDASGNLLVGTTTSLANTSHSFQATGTSNSFWAGTFQHNGIANNGRVLNWKLTNADDTGSYFVFANNSGGNCFNILGNGNVQNTTGTYGTISDLRLKENISDARNYLEDLLKLRVVKYSLKSESSPTANLIGLIAQEVEQVFPTLVETNGDDVKSIKTTVLIPMLLKSIQELTARVQTLEAK